VEEGDCGAFVPRNFGQRTQLRIESSNAASGKLTQLIFNLQRNNAAVALRRALVRDGNAHDGFPVNNTMLMKLLVPFLNKTNRRVTEMTNAKVTLRDKPGRVASAGNLCTDVRSWRRNGKKMELCACERIQEQ
jgi:hypothetical protein